MRIHPAAGPSNPYHLSRAYGANPASASGATPPAAPVRSADVKRSSPALSPAPLTPATAVAGANPSQASESINRLIAAIVPGRVDFSGDTPRAAPATLAFYRHPAEKNAAATGVELGRSIDISA